MRKHNVKVQITRTPNKLELYVRAPFLEEYFKNLSREQYKGKARIGVVRHTSSDRVESGEEQEAVRRGSEDATPEDEVLYRFYKLRRLPDAAYPIKASSNLVEHQGYLRAVGLGKGIRIPTAYPMTSTVAEQLARQVLENIKFMYNTLNEKYTVTGVLDVSKV
jgi:hypothetical protein